MRSYLPNGQFMIKELALLMALVLGGCYFGYWSYANRGGGQDLHLGEEHTTDMSAGNAFVMVQDVLRGDGVLYEVSPGPDTSLVTDWEKAPVQTNTMASMLGVNPQYRYEIQVIPLGSHSSKIIANVHGQDINAEQLATYKPATKLKLFQKFDQLASQFPPPSGTPGSGGVNYALLPNEDLKGLAKRVTGDESNWRQIAADNGIKSPSDVNKLQTIWVRNTLAKHAAPGD